MNNYNKMISKFMKNPGKMFIKMTSDELAEFFSTGYARLTKEKCKRTYTLTDFRRGILQSNHLVKLDEDRYTVDLMMFALGQIEDLTQTVKDLQEIIAQYEATNEEENQESTETDDKKEETKTKK